MSQDRWTVLSYEPPGSNSLTVNLKGHITESWLCVDCGVNTAPGMPNRKEMEIALVLRGKGKTVYTAESEIYTVTKEVWRASGLDGWGGCLCIGCLEQRIGRRLKPEDFVADNGFNDPRFPATRRLRKRRGQR
jgi:hypothetical protein